MKKSKLALLHSVIALLLCVSMLAGTTFAWFTDAVNTGINTIAAGNLDVELYHSNAAVTDERVQPDTELFKDLQGDPILWEPGVVSFENLRVANEGDLALAYQLSLATANENFVVDPSGTQYGLSQILKVGVVEGGITATDRAGVVASVADTDWTTLDSLLRGGSLLPEGAGESEKVWGIVIWWEPGENDNFWNLNNGKQLNEGDVLKIDLGVKLVATQEQHESDAFGSDYDAEAKTSLFGGFAGGTASVTVTTNDQNQTASPVEMASGKVKAYVPAGVQLAEGVSALTLSVAEMSGSSANITLDENQERLSLNVHIEGVDSTNAQPITVTLEGVAPIGLNMGNYKLYHVENGATNEMTYVAADADFTAHNQFKYDPATGDIVLYMATFSEVAVVAEEPKWEGGVDHSWYNATATELVIANADQLWSFSQIVGGMNGQTQDSFAGKTVKLICNINIGDTIADNGLVFYPIGYYNSEGTYERTSTAITSGLRNFEGTFDGNGHTVSNFYQNTWEMKGDHNWYKPEEQYYRDGMGLFGKVYGGTVKNLTIKNFSSDGEIATTGCVAAYADCGATFENIAIFNCNPRVYNIGNGGIVGCVGWYANDAHTTPVTFKNITVDNSNKISALWGSWDVACGGLVGQYYPTSGQESQIDNGGIYMENCHVAAQIDVYNDVCANYQYYAYRYAGILIGSVRENVEKDGHVYPNMDGITASGCTVHFGDWNDYYYCELVANSLASYTHDHQMSRLVQVKEVNGTTVTYLDGTTGTVPASGRYNYVVVKAKDGSGKWLHGDGAEYATCYHFVDGKVWNHADAGKETVDGVEVLKEDKQLVYREFNNLVTGYGWGVTSKGVGELNGVTILDRDAANSVVKFVKADTAASVYTAGRLVKIGELFAAAATEVPIDTDNVQVTVSPADPSSKASGEYKANTDDWTEGTIVFGQGLGAAEIIITDYYYCTSTVITVQIVETFDSLKVTPVKTSVQQGYTFTSADFVVEGVSTSGATAVLTDFTVNGTTANVGQTTVTIRYANLSATCVVAVIKTTVVKPSVAYDVIPSALAVDGEEVVYNYIQSGTPYTSGGLTVAHKGGKVMDLTITGAKPTTQISATFTRTIGDNLTIVGLGYYFGDDLGTLRMIPGQSGATGTVTPDLSGLASGSTVAVKVVVVYQEGVEVVATWTITME